MKKKICAAVCALIILLLAAGCGTLPETFENEKEIGQEDNMETVKLTNEEKELLCSMYSGEERIRRGDLLDHEIALLEQLRFGMSYLSEKYPKHRFEMTACIPQGKMETHTTVSVCAEGVDGVYTLRLETLPDGTCLAEDDFYAVTIREEYTAMLRAAAKAAVAGTLGVWAEFPGLYGMECGAAGYDLAAAAKDGSMVFAECAVYVDGRSDAAPDAVSAALKQALADKGFRGNFYVYVLEEVPEGEITDEALRAFVKENVGADAYVREKFSL